MTDMNRTTTTVFGSGIMLATLLAAFAAFAQDGSDIDDIGPAVDTSATRRMKQRAKRQLKRWSRGFRSR